MATGKINSVGKMIADNAPKTIYRPLNQQAESEWTYTVEASGILLLVFLVYARSYMTVKINGATVGVVALNGGTAPESTTISIPVAKGQVVTVTNLTTNSRLDTFSSLIAYTYQN